MRGGRLWHWYATVLLNTWSLAIFIIMLLSLALSSCKYEAFPRLLFGICFRTFCLGKYSLACVNIYYESLVSARYETKRE